MTMTIPTIPSMPAGYIATGADLNNLAAAATFLLNKPIVRVRDTAGGQAILTTPTIIQFSLADINTDGMWSGAHPKLLTIQTPGWYKVRWMVQCGSNNGPFIGWVTSTTGSNNPAGSGVTSTPYWPGYVLGVGGSTAARCGGSGLWPSYLYQGDQLQVSVQATATGNNTATGAPGVATNGGSIFSLEFKSA